jgi:gamma-glutamylcyclotransferase (GGCT)/AIG2-like uncharacterized protein YtfP
MIRPTNENVMDGKKTVRIAVYGTLKGGYHNHYRLGPTKTFLGKGKVQATMFMIGAGDYPGAVLYSDIPLNNPAKAFMCNREIEVEVFEILEESLEKEVDLLEGHPNHFCRKLVNVGLPMGCKAWMYFLPYTSLMRGLQRVCTQGVWRGRDHTEWYEVDFHDGVVNKPTIKTSMRNNIIAASAVGTREVPAIWTPQKGVNGWPYMDGWGDEDINYGDEVEEEYDDSPLGVKVNIADKEAKPDEAA